MGADIRYALRQIGKSPALAAVVVVTLALGIGVTTVAFTWMRAVLFAQLPVHEPERIVTVWSTSPSRGIPRSPSSAADFVAWREQARSFESLAAVVPGSYNLADENRPAVRASAWRVSPQYFDLLGSSTTVVGRAFQTQDDPIDRQVAVLSHPFWTRHFGGDPTIVGQSITLDGEGYTILGVAADTLRLRDVDLWTPLVLDERLSALDRRELIVLGRLGPDRSVDEARAELSLIARQREQQYPGTNTEWTVNVELWIRTVTGPDTLAFFAVFTGAVLSVLLIGCANVGNLMLARGLGRRQEVAIRLALGAVRPRLVRQFLTESLVLAAIGGAGGLLTAVWLNDLLRATMLGSTPFAAGVRIDAGVLTFVAALSVFSALAFGTAPALQCSALRLPGSLRMGTLAPVPFRPFWSRHTIVAAEVAAAAALLVIAATLIQTGLAVLRASPGFDAAHVLTGQVSLPARGYPDDRAAAFVREVLTDLESQPGVEMAAATSRLPLAGGAANANLTVDVEGHVPTGSARAWAVDVVITPGYFDALRIPLREGRDFGPSDVAGAPGVAIVSETFARRYMHTGPGLDRRIRLGADGRWVRVIAIVADVRNDDLGQPPVPQVYVPHAQRMSRDVSLILRTTRDPSGSRPHLEAAVRRLDPAVAVYRVRTMEQVVMDDIPDVPVIIGILSVCSMLALALAMIGIYGVVTSSVRQQTREFAIRQALGASRGELMAAALGRSARWTIAGLVSGVALALGAARVLAGTVDFVEGVGGGTLSISLMILVSIALAASWLPARAATRVDPMTALRSE